MHTWYYRGNALFTLLTSALAFVCIAVSITGDFVVYCQATVINILSTRLKFCDQLHLTAADFLDKHQPVVEASLVEIQGLQKEYDRWVGTKDKVGATNTFF